MADRLDDVCPATDLTAEEHMTDLQRLTPNPHLSTHLLSRKSAFVRHTRPFREQPIRLPRRRLLVAFAALLGLVGLPGTASAQIDQAALDQAYDMLSVGSFAVGVAAVEGVLPSVESDEERSHLRYLIARASQEAGDCVAASTLYESMQLSASPDDPWAGRARFGFAECQAELGDQAGALTTFSTEAEVLAAAERRLSLAEQVAALATDGRTGFPYQFPDWYRALALYQLVLDLVDEGDLRDESEHFVAALNADTWLLEQRLRRNPEGPWACADRYYLAENTFNVPAMAQLTESCGPEVAVPAALWLSDQSGITLQTLHALQGVMGRFPSHERRGDILTRLALASVSFNLTENSWLDVEAALTALPSDGTDVQFMLTAASQYADQGMGDAARELWNRVSAATTQSEPLDRVRREWTTLRANEAVWLFESGDVDIALGTLDRLIAEIPSEMVNAHMLAGQMLADAERHDGALRRWELAGTHTARTYRAALLESLGRLEQAAPLRHELGFPGRAESLQVLTARSFRSDEVAAVQVRTDGLGEVELRLHQIDVEDHLRSMGTLNGLGDLDVDLIAPDESRTVTLDAPEYEGYRRPGPTSGPIEVTGLSPGVYALQIVGETQQATTLVHVTDLAILSRSVGGDLLTLAVNRRTGAVIEGALIVITNGERVLTEGTTGPDGVFRATVPQGQISILASSGPHSAWTDVADWNDRAEQLLERAGEYERVQIRLDRIEATPGETINYWAWVATGDSPRQLPSGTVEVEVRHNGNLIIHREDTLISGLATGAFVLPDDALSGSYTISVNGSAASVQVERLGPLLPRVRLLQDHPVAAGGTAFLRAVVTDSSGQPVVGHELNGDTGDGQGTRSLGRTDASGILLLEVAVDVGLEAPTVNVEGAWHQVQTTRHDGALETDHDRLTPATPSRLSVMWDGGESAQAVLRIERVLGPQLNTQIEFSPSWSAVQTASHGRQLLAIEGGELVTGQTTLAIPGLDAGKYRFHLDVLRSDGVAHSMSWETDVRAVAEGLSIHLPGHPQESAEFSQTRDVEHGSTLAVQTLSSSNLPVLMTLEGRGIESYWVFEPGVRSIELPEGTMGNARLHAMQSVASGVVPETVLSLNVDRVLNLESQVSGTTDGIATVDLVLTDRDGVGVSSQVFVRLRPVDAEVESGHDSIFGFLERILNGSGGFSTNWAHWGLVSEIDADILTMEAEREFEEERAEILILAADEPMFESWDGDDDMAFGMAGLGSGSGRGLSSHDASRGRVALGRANSAPGTIAYRHRPALFLAASTDASGRLTIATEPGSVTQGWYELDVLVLEGYGVTGQTQVAGDGLTQWQGVYLEAPVVDPRTLWAEFTEGSTSEHRVLLTDGESLTLRTEGAQWAIIDVATGTEASMIPVLLGRDLASRRDRALFLEQVATFDVLSDIDPEVGPGIWRYQAQQFAASASGDRPAAFQDVSNSLRQIERLAEDRVAARLEALLAIGRAQPQHPQGQAALIRLTRQPESHNVDVVGTLALATLSLGEDGESQARTLTSELFLAATTAPLLGRARALEALALLGEPLPLSPRTLLSETPTATSDRERGVYAESLGSVVRAILLSEDYDSAPAGTATLVGAAITFSEADDLTNPEYTNQVRQIRVPLNAWSETMTIAASAGPVALRIQLVNEEPVLSDAGVSIRRVAQRHGVWFRGEDILPPARSRVVAADQLTAGRAARVRLELTGPGTEQTIIIEEQLPPGTQLIPDSISGFRLLDVNDGRLRLAGTVRTSAVVSYEVEVLHPATRGGDLSPGSFLWHAAVVRNRGGVVVATSEAPLLTLADNSRELADRVAGRPVLVAEAAELSNDETFALGVAMARLAGSDDTLHRAAVDALLPLIESGALTPDRVETAGQAAFNSAIAIADDVQIRNLFSLLESRAPGAEVTEAQLLAVTRTFTRQGDYQYAMRAWRALLNLRFLTEIAVGERLLDLGAPEEGLRWVHDLTRVYPDIDSVVESNFNLPQLLLRLGDEQADTPEGRFRTRRLRRTAVRWLGEFLARYGTNDAAPEAALMILQVLADVEEWERLTELGNGLMARYPESEMLDSYLFITAYGQQRLGNVLDAQALYARVVEEEFDGQPSSDRSRAQLALAQIHHAQGDLEAALELYREVSGEFTDANAAVSVLEADELRIPELVDGVPGETQLIPIRSRGVEQVRVWAYQVDLERLFLRENQVRAVEDISLAGIEPTLEQEFSLPVSIGALMEHEIGLELTEPGAYLVLLRSDNVRSSTLVVVSDLQMDIVEDPYSPVLHVSVADRSGAPLESARVRSVASEWDSIHTDETDLRGLVHLDGHDRHAHVVARVGDSYAVYRGLGEDGFAGPSQINTGWYATRDTDLLEGQRSRSRRIQMDNAMEYEGNVLGNRRSSSNFNLY